jgi:hypothetical protein
LNIFIFLEPKKDVNESMYHLFLFKRNLICSL